MRVVRDLQAAPLTAASVVTIGNFDGLHLGHQALISRARKRAQRLFAGRAEVAVVCFEPLPQAYFDSSNAPARILSPAARLKQLRALGVDLVWMMRFNAELASMSAERFVQQVLAESLSTRYLIVGDDFRFGRSRTGNVGLLRQLAEQYGYGIENIAAVTIDGQRVSSSAIRALLQSGSFEQTARLLGRPFRFSGRVMPGQQLGRKLGYATANVRIRNQPCPVQGVLAVRCELEGRPGVFPGVASLGYRPTVGGKELLLEVHLLDFDDDIYYRQITVEPVAKLREEARFDTLQDMVAQMRIDENQAREKLAAVCTER